MATFRLLLVPLREFLFFLLFIKFHASMKVRTRSLAVLPLLVNSQLSCE